MREFLRRALTENLGLKFLSVGLAVVLFLIVRTDKDARAQGYVVVEYQYDSSKWVMTSNPPKQLRISVRGRWSKVNQFDDRKLKPVRIKLTGVQKKSLRFEPELIRLPRGLRVVAISPPSADIRLERLVETKAPLTARIVGDVAAGYELKGRPEVQPPQVLLRGPKSALDKLKKTGLSLAEVDVTNAEGSIEREVSTLASLPKHVKALTSLKVKVRQQIVAQIGEKALIDVPVETKGFTNPGFTPQLSESGASVFLKGPLPVLNKLQASTLKVIVDLRRYNRRPPAGQEVKRTIDPKSVQGLPRGVTVRYVRPTHIKVKFLRKEPGAAAP